MKKLLFLFAVVFSLAAKAQDIDSTKIPQTITLAERYHVYILGNLGSWGTPEMINYINQVRAGYDTSNLNKPITVTVSSAFIRDAFEQMSYQPEGEATQYNENIQNVLAPQITNPWLGAAVYEIRYRNWYSRDRKIEATANRLLQINKLQ